MGNSLSPTPAEETDAPASTARSDDPGDGPDPRCDYVPRPGNSGHRCPQPAVMRVLCRHGGGAQPEYRDRCLLHAQGHIGPRVGAVWDGLRRLWVPID
jgi:hypothetical protein